MDGAMFDLDWLRRVFLGEPPRSARFDLQALDSVSVSVNRAGGSFIYRDRLQAVLDTEWSNLSREEMYLRALEGYRWLELLEKAMAQDPERFTPNLDDAGQILERFVQHAQLRQVNAS